MESARAQLLELAARYAAGVDRRDRDLLLSTMHPRARFSIPATGIALTGHDELPRVFELLARFDRTFHLVGNACYEVAGDTATGEVYCQAHHLRGGQDFTTINRYQDVYARGAGGWRITERTVVIDWTYTVPAGGLGPAGG
ncbi:nuclear transport factor 2 family protein [Actinoplanes sp. NPDC024001]|uniref:nuclear transport factor 2 family protein n=1 Tax=Actinoplanes sp. NPDC024001 TaxID=3154598 RepID=UPI0033E4898A